MMTAMLTLLMMITTILSVCVCVFVMVTKVTSMPLFNFYFLINVGFCCL